MLSSQVMRDEEVEDLTGLESSIAQKDVVVEAGDEEPSLLEKVDTEDPAVTGTSAQV